jgi:hypothetical protein
MEDGFYVKYAYDGQIWTIWVYAHTEEQAKKVAEMQLKLAQKKGKALTILSAEKEHLNNEDKIPYIVYYVLGNSIYSHIRVLASNRDTAIAIAKEQVQAIHKTAHIFRLVSCRTEKEDNEWGEPTPHEIISGHKEDGTPLT